MRQVSLRTFRTRGAQALSEVPRGETVLLSGQDGPAYFLVPVIGDVSAEDRELRRALAKASLREDWKRAERTGTARMTSEHINAEVTASRASARPQLVSDVATMAIGEREVVTCKGCKLVQFLDATASCRRCNKSLQPKPPRAHSSTAASVRQSQVSKAVSTKTPQHAKRLVKSDA